jgi:hypothetical protein
MQQLEEEELHALKHKTNMFFRNNHAHNQMFFRILIHQILIWVNKNALFFLINFQQI